MTKEWAPCLHGPEDKPAVAEFLLAVLNHDDRPPPLPPELRQDEAGRWRVEYPNSDRSLVFPDEAAARKYVSDLEPKGPYWSEANIFLPDQEVAERNYTSMSWKRSAETEAGRELWYAEFKPGTFAAHTRVQLNPKLTESLLWAISDLSIPSGDPERTLDTLRLEFVSDQWVGIAATSTLQGQEVSTWVEADDFTLALAKTLALWRDKLAELEPKKQEEQEQEEKDA